TCGSGWVRSLIDPSVSTTYPPATAGSTDGVQVRFLQSVDAADLPFPSLTASTLVPGERSPHSGEAGAVAHHDNVLALRPRLQFLDAVNLWLIFLIRSAVPRSDRLL